MTDERRSVMPDNTPTTWLWTTNRYDMPLSGIGERGGRLAYLTIANFDDAYAERAEPVYTVHPLTDAEAAEERRIHTEFERRVGTHACQHQPYIGGEPRPHVCSDAEVGFFDEFPAEERRALHGSWAKRSVLTEFTFGVVPDDAAQGAG